MASRGLLRLSAESSLRLYGALSFICFQVFGGDDSGSREYVFKYLQQQDHLFAGGEMRKKPATRAPCVCHWQPGAVHHAVRPYEITSKVVLAAEGVGNGLAGEFDEVRMVGEEENLGARAEFGEDGKCGAGAGVVEADEDVIDYEGQRVA